MDVNCPGDGRGWTFEWTFDERHGARIEAIALLGGGYSFFGYVFSKTVDEWDLAERESGL